MRRGFTYTTSFAIKELPGNTALNLTGATAGYVIGTKEFPATIDTPATLGTISVNLTPTQTATVPKGRHTVLAKVTFSENDIQNFGVHRVTVE
jgi:hypothetical protein